MPHETIFRTLKSVRLRQRLVAVVQTSIWGLVGGATAAALVAAWRFRGLSDVSVLGGWMVLFGVPTFAAVGGGIRCLARADWRLAARAVDRRYDLKDRTETAIAFLQRQPSRPVTDLETLQLVDAEHHLQQVEPRQVVPLELPPSWRWAAVCVLVAVTLLCWPSRRQELAADLSEPLPEIVAVAKDVDEELQQLAEQLAEMGLPEIDSLVQELQAKVDALKEPGVDQREALAKLSEMQSLLQGVSAEFNLAQVDEQLKAVGETLTAAKALEQAGQALLEGQLDKAADELTKLDKPALDRHESRSVSDKLKKNAANAGEKGLNKLQQAAQEMSEGLDKDNPSQSQSGVRKLSELTKQQFQRKKVASLLKSQSDKLGECKANCQSNRPNDRSGNKLANNPSQQAGKGSNSEVLGQRTELGSKNNRENIQGQKSEQGDSEKERLTTPEADDHAQRGYRDVYQKYRKLSEAVLDQEDIPLGNRQTIRRYFEAIRPTRDEGVGSPQ